MAGLPCDGCDDSEKSFGGVKHAPPNEVPDRPGLSLLRTRMKGFRSHTALTTQSGSASKVSSNDEGSGTAETVNWRLSPWNGWPE